MNFFSRAWPIVAATFAMGLSYGASDETALQGTWKPISAELGGRAMPPAAIEAITLKMKDLNYEVSVKGEGTDRGFTKLLPNTTPKAMDITSTNGANNGKTFSAIYEINGEKLRICYNLAGTNRPAVFKTVTNTALYLVTYQLKKD
jgi:uncharacterized protein (TIGR03067 family)